MAARDSNFYPTCEYPAGPIRNRVGYGIKKKKIEAGSGFLKNPA